MEIVLARQGGLTSRSKEKCIRIEQNGQSVVLTKKTLERILEWVS